MLRGPTSGVSLRHLPEERALKPCLPHDDPDPAARRAAVDRARDGCRWNTTYLPPLAFADKVPEGQGPGLGWLAAVAETMVTLQVNSRKIEQHQEKSSRIHEEHEKIRARITGGEMSAAAIMKHLVDFVMEGGAYGRPSSIADYGALFQEVPRPPGTSVFDEDQVFARLRVAGPNPMTLRRIGAIDDRFPVSDAHLQDALGPQDSLAGAAAEGRLYLADYALLAGAQTGTFPHTQKYLSAPLALFAVPAGRSASRPLVPVAIQCAQEPGPQNPVFTPRDGWGWRMAKTMVQVADGNVHQAVSHMAHTHLVLEPIVVAALRTLAPCHPVAVLLAPHFEGTLEVNDMAQAQLLAPGGGVDTVMAGSIEASRGLIVKARQDFVFADAMVPRALRLRGVDDAGTLPDYPYRDDALLLWDAIRSWIDSYLRLYYAGDGSVVADVELQRWVGEASAADGGGLRGFGQDGRMPSLAALVDALTLVVFTASAQHAAVNFPQYPVMSFVPNMPLAAYRPAPTRRDGLSEADRLAMLPPLDLAHMQLSLGYLLGSVNVTRLGVYGDLKTNVTAGPGLHIRSAFENAVDEVLHHPHFVDARVAEPLGAFQRTLREAESTIEDRNTVRAPYTFLLPSRVPASINM
jgi:arachidonate 15-lipoxygenase